MVRGYRGIDRDWRLDEAHPVLDDQLARANSSQNPNAVAIGERCRGLLFAGRGDIVAGIDAMEAALAAHALRPLAPEVARTMLERGTLERRAKHKTSARQSLQQAAAALGRMGEVTLAARAQDELSRIGLRRAVVSDGLTPAQQRVAELVASGMGNREVAGALFMSLRSVEAHLTKVYRELGVRSRSQLVASLSAQATSGEPSRPPVSLNSHSGMSGLSGPKE